MNSHIFTPKVIDSIKLICSFRLMSLPLAPAPDVSGASKFVDEYLLYQLASASQSLSNEFHREVKASGVKVHVWRVLACVIDQPGLMLTTLAKLVLYEQSRLTKIIDQMVEDGLVDKRPVAEDRRKMAIFVTPKGRRLVTPLLATAKEHEKKALNSLTESERITLKRVLNKLSKRPTPAGEEMMS